MRVIILTWEFPPRIVGQLSYYVNNLAITLVNRGVDTYVVTYSENSPGYHSGDYGIKAVKVSNPVKAQLNVLSWSLTLNQEFEKAVADIYYSVNHRVDIIDVHDWHCVPAAASLKKAFQIPFIFSVDSLEDHRSHGANTPLNLSLKSIERLGAHESQRVIAKSDWMKQEVSRIYNVPSEKIDVVSLDSPRWIDEILKSYEKSFSSSNNR